jgi:hypothetical protein
MSDKMVVSFVVLFCTIHKATYLHSSFARDRDQDEGGCVLVCPPTLLSSQSEGHQLPSTDQLANDFSAVSALSSSRLCTVSILVR